jgi:hypothetical protein
MHHELRKQVVTRKKICKYLYCTFLLPPFSPIFISALCTSTGQEVRTVYIHFTLEKVPSAEEEEKKVKHSHIIVLSVIHFTVRE